MPRLRPSRPPLRVRSPLAPLRAVMVSPRALWRKARAARSRPRLSPTEARLIRALRRLPRVILSRRPRGRTMMAALLLLIPWIRHRTCRRRLTCLPLWRTYLSRPQRILPTLLHRLPAALLLRPRFLLHFPIPFPRFLRFRVALPLPRCPLLRL